jgi:hypothetical protein
MNVSVAENASTTWLSHRPTLLGMVSDWMGARGPGRPTPRRILVNSCMPGESKSLSFTLVSRLQLFFAGVDSPWAESR